LLCRACSESFPQHDAAVAVPLPVERAWALALFQGPARRLLIDLKYAGVLRAGVMIGTRMGSAPGARSVLAGTDLVVPVPLHWRRRWRRGHNQAAVLARALCRQQPELRFVPALWRRRATAPQVGQPRERRLLNVTGAFALRARHRDTVSGRTVVLVDDVITTGATSVEAACCLLAAGAADVRVYAAAWSQ
jgi:predicted amidophosphoribosyltransferase